MRFVHIPCRDLSGPGVKGWTRVDPRHLRSFIASVLEEGSGVPEVAEDPSDDLRFLIASGPDLDRTYPDPEALEGPHVREVTRAGREFYSLFLRADRTGYLGTIEMLEAPPSGWMKGQGIPMAGEGEAFCAPTVTLPFDAMRHLLVSSLLGLEDTGPGVHVHRWLYEDSTAMSRVEPLGSDAMPYHVALSAVLGLDLTGEVEIDHAIAPGDQIRGFFVGTLPGRSHPGRLVGARSVELALSMALSLKGDKGMLSRTDHLLRGIPDDKALFGSLDRYEMDPFFLQKIFKLNKALMRLGEPGSDAIFPDTRTVNIVASSRRRGLSADDISHLAGMGMERLRELEEAFGIRPSIEPGSSSSTTYKPCPLVLNWPEPSMVLEGKMPQYAPSIEGKVLVTTVLRDAFDPDADGILYADPDEDVMGSLRTAYPEVIFLSGDPSARDET